MKNLKRNRTRAVLAACLVSSMSYGAAAKDITGVGVTVGSLGNPFFLATVKGIQAKARELTPNAKVTALSSDYDLNKQVNQVDSFIAAGDQIIMISADDPQAIGAALMRARTAGVTVMAFDTASAGAEMTVVTDNVTAGEKACQFIVDHLPGGKGNVIVLGGPHVTPVVDRVSGCLKVLKNNPGVNILSDNQNPDVSRDSGLKFGISLLSRFPKVDAVFGNTDPASIGFELAARQLGRKDFFITSVDGSPDIIPEIKDRNGLIKASVAQDPFGMSGKAYEYAVQIANGAKLPPGRVLMMPTLYSIDNIADYKGWLPPGDDK